LEIRSDEPGGVDNDFDEAAAVTLGDAKADI
jgi:hypothetical protein